MISTRDPARVIDCFVYMIGCFIGIFAPQYQGTVFNYSSPIMFGEIAFILCLEIKGAKPQPPLEAPA